MKSESPRSRVARDSTTSASGYTGTSSGKFAGSSFDVTTLGFVLGTCPEGADGLGDVADSASGFSASGGCPQARASVIAAAPQAIATKRMETVKSHSSLGIGRRA